MHATESIGNQVLVDQNLKYATIDNEINLTTKCRFKLINWHYTQRKRLYIMERYLICFNACQYVFKKYFPY